MGSPITNTWIGGLTRSSSKGKQDNRHLFDNYGFNIITEKGLSTAALESLQGNKLYFNIPDTYNILRIDIIGTGSVDVTINGVLATFNITPATTVSALGELFQSSYASLIANDQIKIHYNSDYIVIVGLQANPTVSFNILGILDQSILCPATTNHCIIGWNFFREDVFLFTTNRNNILSNPGGVNPDLPADPATYGFIWKFTYDREELDIVSPNGSTLNVINHLYYGNLLNFSLPNEIYRECIGRYENQFKQRCYWTDNFNRPRVFNFANPNHFAIPVGLLDWTPDFTPDQPIVQSIVSGGSWNVGKIGFFYKLKTLDGLSTNFSTVSYLVDLTSSLPTEPFQEFTGDPAGINSGKAVTIKISDIDERFDVIEVGVVVYETPGVPLFYVVREDTITSSEMDFTLTGGEPRIALSLAEFIGQYKDFKTVKTFTQKYNILYPANITTESFEIPYSVYDCRAYRFNSAAQCNIWDRNNNIFNVTTANWLTVPENHDAVNPYNDESGQLYNLNPSGTFATWQSTYQYKFQSDGLTVGGEGPNVSYRFVTESLQSDVTVPTPLFPTAGAYSATDIYPVFICPFISATSVNSTETLAPGEVYPLSSYTNLKSPLRSSVLKTVARGETYRCSVVYYNEKGQASFAQWIGDIRVPEPIEYNGLNTTLNPDNYDLASTNGGASPLSLNVIGIEFTFNNLNTLLSQGIVAYQVCIVERTNSNKTRFGHGMHLPVLEFHGTSLGSDTAGFIDINGISTQAYGIGYFKASPGLGGAEYTYLGPAGLFDNNIGSGDGQSYTRTNYFFQNPRLSYIKGPLNDFSIIPETISEIRLIEEFEGRQSQYFATNNLYNTTYSHAWWIKYNDTQRIDTYRINTITAQDNIGVEGVVPSSVAPGVMLYDFHNVCEEDTVNAVSGLGSSIHYVVTGEPILRGNSGTPNYTNPQLNTDLDPYRIVSYINLNKGQYGGPWFSARSNNIYVPQGPLVTITSNNQTQRVFGDTFMNYYDAVLYAYHWGQSYDVPSRGSAGSGLGSIYNLSSDQKAVAICVPVESPINTDMRHGKHWARNQLFTTSYTNLTSQQEEALNSFAQFTFDEPEYNFTYSQQFTSKVFIAKPINVQLVEELPHHIYGSLLKIDGESIDSWTKYPENDFLVVEGTNGEINKVVNSLDRILCYQDRSITFISSQERSSVQDNSGAVYQIGTGQKLLRYDYLSKDTGSINQHSVIVAPDGVYHWDGINSKIYFTSSQGVKPISDETGMEPFFRDINKGDIYLDQPLLHSGVHGVYDTKYNKCIFTFLWPPQNETNSTSFSINYNRVLNEFEQFFPFKPSLYLSTTDFLISPDSQENISAFAKNNEVFIHHQENLYGIFYNRDPEEYYVTFFVKIIDGNNLITGKLDLVDFWTEVFDQNGINLPLNTITGIEVSTDYQNTGNLLTPLIVNQRVKRRERGWRINFFRNQTDLRPLRDKYFKITLYFQNEVSPNNKRIIIHDFNSIITNSKH